MRSEEARENQEKEKEKRSERKPFRTEHQQWHPLPFEAERVGTHEKRKGGYIGGFGKLKNT